jgi:hypothetical protein
VAVDIAWHEMIMASGFGHLFVQVIQDLGLKRTQRLLHAMVSSGCHRQGCGVRGSEQSREGLDN